LFLVWDGVILGSISTPEMADKIADPLQQLLSVGGRNHWWWL
jgi:tyrosine-specific transport protein